jgi:hypothetical protein
MIVWFDRGGDKDCGRKYLIQNKSDL